MGHFFVGQNPKSIDILAYMYVNLYLGPPCPVYVYTPTLLSELLLNLAGIQL